MALLCPNKVFRRYDSTSSRSCSTGRSYCPGTIPLKKTSQVSEVFIKLSLKPSLDSGVLFLPGNRDTHHGPPAQFLLLAGAASSFSTRWSPSCPSATIQSHFTKMFSSFSNARNLFHSERISQIAEGNGARLPNALITVVIQCFDQWEKYRRRADFFLPSATATVGARNGCGHS